MILLLVLFALDLPRRLIPLPPVHGPGVLTPAGGRRPVVYAGLRVLTLMGYSLCCLVCFCYMKRCAVLLRGRNRALCCCVVG
jgi:hypothetical protein